MIPTFLYPNITEVGILTAREHRTPINDVFTRPYRTDDVTI